MGGAMSRRKGATAERRAAKFLSDNGMPASRAARCGVDGGDDIMCPGLKIALEVKDSMAVRPGTKAMDNAIKQAETLAQVNRLDHAGVLWWEARSGWRLTMCTWLFEKLVDVTIHDQKDIVRILVKNYEGAKP
jgi:Holliday junction resolvase